jgi:hypothetical protein
LRITRLIAVGALLLSSAPLAAEAQSAARGYRIGVLHSSLAQNTPAFAEFRERLRDLGYVEGLTWPSSGTS